MWPTIYSAVRSKEEEEERKKHGERNIYKTEMHTLRLHWTLYTIISIQTSRIDLYRLNKTCEHIRNITAHNKCVKQNHFYDGWTACMFTYIYRDLICVITFVSLSLGLLWHVICIFCCVCFLLLIVRYAFDCFLSSLRTAFEFGSGCVWKLIQVLFFCCTVYIKRTHKNSRSNGSSSSITSRMHTDRVRWVGKWDRKSWL